MSLWPAGPVHCSKCDEELTDRTSRMFGIGPVCRGRMSPAELAQALRERQERAKPGYIPPQRPASPQARLNNAEARLAAERPGGRAGLCGHGGVVGACPKCRQADDPAQAAARIIAEIQRERREERERQWRAARHAPA